MGILKEMGRRIERVRPKGKVEMINEKKVYFAGHGGFEKMGERHGLICVRG